ncbi:cytochrome-c peroxidase [Frateuria defendens]|uniref:cytochrome-c peroxidase n=1 Tax=Frateuria defendens TaxID=2219559 RepID=UPI00066FB9B1|nr:cytochrome-c peroxidase [Frateuria defendens]
MKKLIVAIVLAAIAYGGLVAYIEHFDHSTAPTLRADSPSAKDPVAQAAFGAITEARCDYCHAQKTNLPFYFHVPVAAQLMQHDVDQGLRHFRIEPVLNALEDGKAPSELQLARIEEVVRQQRMPPKLYLTLHWHAHLGAAQNKALLDWVAQTRRKYYATPGVAPQFAAEPVQPIPESLGADPRQVTLGQKLFFDTRLSGDGTVNCASCHALTHAGVDGLDTATGIGGQKGPINTPTVFNAAFNTVQFWNGRAADLAAQAAGPVMNPKEMGSHDWKAVAERVAADPAYAVAFTEAFGSGTVDKDTITRAIAAYETTLITPDSRFDEYLKGDTKALTAQELHGYELFKSVGCSGCHAGKALGGRGLEVFGLEGDYFGERGGQLTDADLGRFTVTNNPLDRERFKVPTLRNVALTAPYFHDASAKTLPEAVRQMVKYQTPAGTLPEQDINDIVAFLDSLTGKYQGKLLSNAPASDPAAQPAAPQGVQKQ